jgi:uncharacterized protein (TIGR02996 family)
MTELRNVELEAAILRDPLDVDAYLVYADWLEGHGDPRAELIALQCGTRPVQNLGKAVRRILANHARTLLGPLASYAQHDGERFTWRYGFIHGAKLHDGMGSLADILELLVSHPSGRFVTELSLSTTDVTAPAVLARLVALAPPLRQLGWYSSTTRDLGETSLGALWPAFPQLTRLVLSGAFDLTELAVPHATEAQLRIDGLTAASARAIALAPWPRVARLELSFSDTTATAADLAPLFARADLVALTHLALTDAPFADDLCALLAAAPFAGQLRSLDLHGEELTDAGAHALAAASSAFELLTHLNVCEAMLTDDGYTALDSMGVVEVETDRYDSTEE